MARVGWVALSISIASALFLPAAEAEIPRPSPRIPRSLSEQRNEARQHNQSRPKPAPTANTAQQPRSPDGHPGPNVSRGDGRQNERSWFGATRAWASGVSAQGFFNFLVAAATAATATFSYLLYRATKRLERAWVLVGLKEAEIQWFADEAFFIKIILYRKNSGRSPAWITGGVTKGSKLSGPLPDIPNYEGDRSYGPEPWRRLNRRNFLRSASPSILMPKPSV